MCGSICGKHFDRRGPVIVLDEKGIQEWKLTFCFLRDGELDVRVGGVDVAGQFIDDVWMENRECLINITEPRRWGLGALSRSRLSVFQVLTNPVMWWS